VAQVNDGGSLGAALKTPVAKLTPGQRKSLFAYYLQTTDTVFRQEQLTLRKLRQRRSKTVDGLREIMVMRELKKRRRTFLLTRGEYDKPAQRVLPNTPAVFPPFPQDAPANRLGLAKWLTDPNHPLTARVAVNRYWQLIFGRGLIDTPEDFGSQGSAPSHPGLLDWLARDFVRHGWNVKRLMKMLVMSATYRQSSRLAVGPEQANLLKRDPENRLLSRGPSYRLSAEMLRDSALAVSGLLVNKVGGPPVRPYELEASFKPVRRDRGAGLYRRSLYTYWKRTAPAPVMMVLDASKREVCRVKRERTSSPLQSLALLNSPQFVEAARMLAQRLLRKHGDNTNAILTELFRRLTSRRPKKAERELLTKLYRQQVSYYEKHRDKAAAFLKVGDSKADPKLPSAKLAAMGVVANTLMNFDECVMKR
ncbi:MAG: DUF1553 domain-containing protein, partial [Planctomycetes bacterium]|nr:DUF1553 domain-containing protein [Planctomycetota bacterium]